MKAFPLFFTLNIISLFSFNTAINITEERLKDLDKMISSQIISARLPTFGIIITNKNQTIFQKIYGENNEVTEKTPFIIGSVSKSFTALGVLKSGEDLNKTLDKFENLKDYIKDDVARDITVGELLNHTSGLESFGSHKIYEKGNYHYSNYGFSLLGKVIESKSGMSYNDFMTKNIFTPLSMKDTKAEYREDIIESYENFFGFRTKYGGLKSEIGDGFFIPAGFISTTVEDMGKYLRYYLDKDSDDYKNYISRMIESNLSVGYKEKYGMGLIIQEKNGMKVIQHGGATNSFLCNLFVYPDIDLGLFVITNYNDVFCSKPTSELFKNIESFLLYDTYSGISSNLFFFIHFTLDIIIIIIICIPLCYLIITIVRRIKKEKYTWFNGVKGIIAFIVDLIFLILLPLVIIIFLFAASADLRYAVINSKDILLALFGFTSPLFLNFITKLVYVFVYRKFFKKFELEDAKKVEQMDYNYIGVEDER